MHRLQYQFDPNKKPLASISVELGLSSVGALPAINRRYPARSGTNPSARYGAIRGARADGFALVS